MEQAPFGRTGHPSSRVIFGAAALGSMKQAKADAILELLFEFGVNHLDTAAIYGDSELRIGPWLEKHRDRFFVATKTGERTAEGARASVERSRERLGVDQLDLIQLHNLVDEREWQVALGPGGALEALVQARERGHVRFIGVTGHGTRVAAMHLRSLQRFPFDSVLIPYSFPMLAQPEYAADVEALLALCRESKVAVQTIKAIARRRWPEGTPRRHSWYEPIGEPAAIRRAARFVLGRPGLFLNSSSDASLLRPLLEAASESVTLPETYELEADVARLGLEPLFVRGGMDAI